MPPSPDGILFFLALLLFHPVNGILQRISVKADPRVMAVTCDVHGRGDLLFQQCAIEREKIVCQPEGAHTECLQTVILQEHHQSGHSHVIP